MHHIKKEHIKEVHHHLKKIGKKRHYNFFFQYKYKKLTVLIISIVLAYFLFSKTPLGGYVSSLGGLSYLGTFIAGGLFAFGFLAAISAGYFITLDPSNIILHALIASIGTLIADLAIFRFIKLSFADEFKRLKKSPVIEELNILIDKSFLHKIKMYLYYSFIGIVIASPLPDEIGISMLAGLTKIKAHSLAIISYILHFIGFLILFLI